MKKKSQKEEKQAGQVKQTLSPSLAEGLDPLLFSITESLLASAVGCRIISIPLSSLLAEAIISGLLPGGGT